MKWGARYKRKIGMRKEERGKIKREFECKG
jgi:hypothetical protein